MAGARRSLCRLEAVGGRLCTAEPYTPAPPHGALGGLMRVSKLIRDQMAACPHACLPACMPTYLPACPHQRLLRPTRPVHVLRNQLLAVPGCACQTSSLSTIHNCSSARWCDHWTRTLIVSALAPMPPLPSNGAGQACALDHSEAYPLNLIS